MPIESLTLTAAPGAVRPATLTEEVETIAPSVGAVRTRERPPWFTAIGVALSAPPLLVPPDGREGAEVDPAQELATGRGNGQG